MFRLHNFQKRGLASGAKAGRLRGGMRPYYDLEAMIYRSSPCSVLQVDFTWPKIHTIPNHSFSGFAGMPQRIVENEQNDMALLKSR